MEFQSCFDIIGPIMVGPSSSHTAGVVSIGRFVYELLEGCPEEVHILFYDSFAETYQGHGTDKALLGGLLGMDTDDPHIRYSIELAHERGMNCTFQLEEHCLYFDHPNTTIVTARRGAAVVRVGGASLGGGLSKLFMIDDEMVDIRLSTSDDFSIIVEKYRKKKRKVLVRGV
ncbi:serine dehydratase beta chain [Bacillus sp. B190/17]|uniref:L-serine ammonia-lyase n=1 Tax=Bacillus lumedeiriae TaxID=3058829 RepID=A0ABW8IAX8_9BACI